MKCEEFNKNLMEFIEEELPVNVRAEMRKHIGECESCKNLYENKLFTKKQFNEVLANNQMEFSSHRLEIMNSINNSKYKVSYFKKLCHHFNIYKGGYIAVAAMIALVLFIVPWMSKLQSNNSPNVVTNITDVKIVNTSTQTHNYNTEDVNKILDDLKTKDLGVGPWRVVYADNKEIYFYNYSHLLVYNDSLKGISSGVDLEKLNVGGYQGSDCVGFIPSKNGEFCVFGKYAPELDDPNNSGDLCILDSDKNKLQIIGKEDLARVCTAWSDSSQYFVYADLSGERVDIYDSAKETNIQFVLNKGTIKDIFVSDNGDVLINSDKTYLLRKGDEYKPIELNIQGEPLGFKDNDVVYFSNGIIYQYDLTKSKEINKIGAGYSPYEQKKVDIIFTKENSFEVYDINNNELYEYSNMNYNDSYIFSPDLKKFLDTSGSYVKVIDCNGQVYECKDAGNPFEYNWMDNNTLVNTPFKDNFKYLGDFTIIKLNVITDNKSEIFEMK